MELLATFRPQTFPIPLFLLTKRVNFQQQCNQFKFLDIPKDKFYRAELFQPAKGILSYVKKAILTKSYPITFRKRHFKEKQTHMCWMTGWIFFGELRLVSLKTKIVNFVVVFEWQKRDISFKTILIVVQCSSLIMIYQADQSVLCTQLPDGIIYCSDILSQFSTIIWMQFFTLSSKTIKTLLWPFQNFSFTGNYFLRNYYKVKILFLFILN